MIVHPAYPGGRSTKAISSQIDLAPTLLGLTGKPFNAVAGAGAGLPGRDLSKLLSAPEQASTDAVRRQRYTITTCSLISTPSGSPH